MSTPRLTLELFIVGVPNKTSEMSVPIIEPPQPSAIEALMPCNKKPE